jgi:hypothetical protein
MAAAKNSIILWRDIYRIADEVCSYFGLSYGKILPGPKGKGAWSYGECWPCDKCINAQHITDENCNEKIIYLRLHQINRPRIPLASKTILRTLAHELAHLREWKHGPHHVEFEAEIIEFMKDSGLDL